MSNFAYKKKILHCEGISIGELCRKKETPFYLYSSKTIKSNFNSLKQQLKGTKHIIAYAVKANSNIAILKYLANLGAGADVVSLGELKKANIAGIPYKKIVYSGVGKKDEEIAFAIEAGILQFNVESHEELLRIAEIAKQKKKKANIAMRVNPDVIAGGHPKISTGKKYDKFGISIEEAVEAYKYAKNIDSLNVIGIDMHIGSQIVKVGPFKSAFNKIVEYTRILEKLGIVVKNIDLGGGIGINYMKENTTGLIKNYSELVKNVYKKLNKNIIIEPGRYLVGDAGILITKIIFKKNSLGKNFLIVDAGMNDFMRPALYSARHIIKNIELDDKKTPISKYDIVGPICETADIFAENLKFNSAIKAGDILYIEKVGAYGSVMSSNYNTREAIEEIMVSNKKYYTIRKKTTIQEIIDKEKIPTWLL